MHYNNRLGKGYFVKKTKELRINPDRQGKSTLIPMYKIQQSEKYIHTKINCTFLWHINKVSTDREKIQQFPRLSYHKHKIYVKVRIERKYKEILMSYLIYRFRSQFLSILQLWQQTCAKWHSSRGKLDNYTIYVTGNEDVQ